MSARKLVPYVLAGIGVGLCLLVIASAGLVAYDRATRPAPQEVAAQDGPVEKDAEAPADASVVTDEAPAPEPEPAPDAESEPAEPDFVRTARKELGVPNDPDITYQIGEPYYWEGVGITVTPITFYQGDVIVASADCTDEGSPATTILAYPGMLS